MDGDGCLKILYLERGTEGRRTAVRHAGILYFPSLVRRSSPVTPIYFRIYTQMFHAFTQFLLYIFCTSG